MNYTERMLTCVECGNEFAFSAEDQQFHASRGYQDPKRCSSCRAQRRASRGGGDYGSSSYGSGGGYDRPQRQMFSATCAQCGKEALVPFEPRGDKPVYCSDCYQPRTSRW